MWETSFYTFGMLGITWVFLWLCFYVDAPRDLPRDEIPLFTPKVSFIFLNFLLIFLCLSYSTVCLMLGNITKCSLDGVFNPLANMGDLYCSLFYELVQLHNYAMVTNVSIGCSQCK